MTRNELLNAYSEGKRNFRGADLSGADLSRADLSGADLSRAYLSRANLSRAYLSGAYLSGANLSRANLSGAYLRGADLSRAYLSDADLSDADLRGADLHGADLHGVELGKQWIIQGATRSDGYQFLLTNFTGEGLRVKAGCRNFTLEKARNHWGETRKGTPLGDETFAILDCLETIARMRGLI